MHISNGIRTLKVTEKAYRIIYKSLGYRPCEIIEFPPDGGSGIPEFPEIDDITKDEIIGFLFQRGVEYNPKDKKDILYNLMIEGD